MAPPAAYMIPPPARLLLVFPGGLTEERLHLRHRPLPVELPPDVGHALPGKLRPEPRVANRQFKPLRQMCHVPAAGHERRLAVQGIVPAAAVVVGHERRAARHRLHGRHPEPLVPRRAEEDPAAAVEPRQPPLREIFVVLVVGPPPPPSFPAAP